MKNSYNSIDKHYNPKVNFRVFLKKYIAAWFLVLDGVLPDVIGLHTATMQHVLLPKQNFFPLSNTGMNKSYYCLKVYDY